MVVEKAKDKDKDKPWETRTHLWEGTFGLCAMQKMSIRRCSLCKSQANLFDSPRKPFQSQLKRLPPKANIWTTFSLAGHCTTLFSALEKNAAQPGKVGYQQKALIENQWMEICVWVVTKKMENVIWLKDSCGLLSVSSVASNQHAAALDQRKQETAGHKVGFCKWAGAHNITKSICHARVLPACSFQNYLEAIF